MQRHLPLTGGEGDWRLDERTRAIGRRGIAEARQALREARHAGGSRHHWAQRACQDGLPCTSAPALPS